MKFLPYEEYTLVTELSEDVVLERFSRYIKNREGLSVLWPSFDFRDNVYEGEISGKTFRMFKPYNRIRGPIISGKISNVNNQTRIYIKMNLSMYDRILSYIWFGLLGILCVCLFSFALLNFNQIRNPVGLLIPLVMFLFLYILQYGSFKQESGESRDFLRRLLEGKEEPK